jgi:hypothetical protein
MENHRVEPPSPNRVAQTRRAFLGLALALPLRAVAPVEAQTRWPYRWSYVGCCLVNGEEAELGITAGLIESSRFSGEVGTSSGDRTLDRAIGTTLSRLSDLFEVHPGFGFFDDGQAPNAYATTRTMVPGTSGSVVFGVTLLRRQIQQAPSGVSVMGVLAHEFGHIVQFTTGVHRTLSAGQSTARLAELHADFLAGYYAGRRARSNTGMDTDSLGDAFRAIGDMNREHPNHHGTPRERVRALTAGFRHGKDTGGAIAEAVRTGIATVRGI